MDLRDKVNLIIEALRPKFPDLPANATCTMVGSDTTVGAAAGVVFKISIQSVTPGSDFANAVVDELKKTGWSRVVVV